MMDRLFNFDNPVMRFLSKALDMMVLNLLFLICSIPIFTIGASLSALHYCCLKMKDPDEGYAYKNFFKSFKMNFKQGTLMWLIMLPMGLILFWENRMASQIMGDSIRPTRIMILIASMLWYMFLTWMFALQSRFVNTIGGTMKNAILLAFGKAPRTIAMVLIMVGELLLAVRAPAVVQSYLLLYVLMFGVSVQVLINTELQYPVIKSLMPEETEETAADNQFVVDETADVSGLGYTPLPKKTEETAADNQFVVDETADVSGLGYTPLPKKEDSI